jgi:hypothetical protein
MFPESDFSGSLGSHPVGVGFYIHQASA